MTGALIIISVLFGLSLLPVLVEIYYIDKKMNLHLKFLLQVLQLFIVIVLCLSLYGALEQREQLRGQVKGKCPEYIPVQERLYKLK